MGKIIKILIILVITVVFSFLMFSFLDLDHEEINQKETNWQWVEKQKKIYQVSSDEIDLILQELWQRFPEKGDRLKAISILRLDTPYQLGCLGEESGRDKDPIFRLDLTDCTVFVLTNVALLNSKSLEEARELMRFINYQPGKDITFENRLHFTIDRNLNSPYFQDVTEKLAGKDRIISKEIILNKVKKDGKRLIDINWQKKMIIKYIPSIYLTEEFLDSLPKELGIAFVKNENFELGLDISHEGFLFDGRQLFHASSSQGKVVITDFFDFYFEKDRKNPKYDGIILFDVI